MANLFDYIQEVEYDSFYDIPLTKLDLLALTELSYLPFDQLVSPAFSREKGTRLDHLAQAFQEAFTDGFPPFSMVTKNRLKLLRVLASANRFKYIKVFAFVDEVSLDLQKQFSALCFSLNRQQTVVSFRGTDDTIIGWKEDFHMTYLEEIPAQKSALLYLQQVMEEVGGTFFVTGHSKGGNLALFASSLVESDLQERIVQVLAFDAPGLHKTITQSAGYQAITEKFLPIVPQNSIVGMMLEQTENAQIVYSNTIGLLQHITFSWEVIGLDFKPAQALTDNSLQTDQTLKTWTASLTEEELRHFFDLFFGIFIEAGIHRFSDLTVDTPLKIRQVIENGRQLSPQEQAMMERLIRQLIDTRYQIWKESLAHSLSKPPALLDDWWQQFQEQSRKKEES